MTFNPRHTSPPDANEPYECEICGALGERNIAAQGLRSVHSFGLPLRGRHPGGWVAAPLFLSSKRAQSSQIRAHRASPPSPIRTYAVMYSGLRKALQRPH